MSDSLPVYDWPDCTIDRKAFDQAFAELGEDVPLSKVMARAQAIKEQLQLAARRIQ